MRTSLEHLPLEGSMLLLPTRDHTNRRQPTQRSATVHLLGKRTGGSEEDRSTASTRHLEHLTITRKTVTGLADRLPSSPPELPEHPDYPRILAAFNHATRPLRVKDACEALGHELLPTNIEGARAKLKRLVRLGILTEADTGTFARKQ